MAGAAMAGYLKQAVPKEDAGRPLDRGASILERPGEIPGFWRSPGFPAGFLIILHLSEKRKEKPNPRALFVGPGNELDSGPQGGEAGALTIQRVTIKLGPDGPGPVPPGTGDFCGKKRKTYGNMSRGFFQKQRVIGIFFL